MNPVSQLSSVYPSMAFKSDEKVSKAVNCEQLVVLLNSNESIDDYIQEMNDQNIANLSTIQLSPIEFNYINTNQLYEALMNVDFWSAICITSKRSVDAIERALNCNNNKNNIIDLWKTNNKRVFVLGNKSSDYLRSRLDWESVGSHCLNAEMLASLMINDYRHELIGKHVLFPCSHLRRDSLPQLLSKNDINVSEIIAYETIPNTHLAERVLDLQKYLTHLLDNSLSKTLKVYFVFFSPSGLNSVYKFLFDYILSENTFRDRLEIKYIGFGGTTTASLQQLGLSVWFTSPKPNPKSLAQALYQNLNIESQKSKLKCD